MSKRAEGSADTLKAKMSALFEETMAEVMAAVNAAPAGNVIRGSELRVKQLMDDFKRKTFEAAAQLAADSQESAFSPSDGSSDR